jgi:hypothetical protein
MWTALIVGVVAFWLGRATAIKAYHEQREHLEQFFRSYQRCEVLHGRPVIFRDLATGDWRWEPEDPSWEWPPGEPITVPRGRARNSS